MRRPATAAVVPIVMLLVGAGIGVGVVMRQRARHHGPAAVSIRSSGDPIVGGLDALVDGSQLVVIGRAVAVRDGRLFADRPDLVGVRSQLVEVQVAAVLAGVAPGHEIVIEEEAMLADGRRLIVDGLGPTRADQQGIWFLRSVGDGADRSWITVSFQGRFLRRTNRAGDDRLVGSSLPDPLVRGIVAAGGRALTDAVIARSRAMNRLRSPRPTG